MAARARPRPRSRLRGSAWKGSDATSPGGIHAERGSGTRSAILEGAFALFAEKGFAGATTREIAERADVNEVTIFRHFGSKESLFQAVIELYSPVAMLTEELAERLTGDDVRANLTHLATQYLAVATPRAKVIHLGMMEAAREPELQRIVGQIPQRLEQHLVDYLTSLQQRGLVRMRDYRLVAHIYYAILLQHVLACSGTPDCMRRPLVPDPELAATLADIMVEYLRPQHAAASLQGGNQ
jgi:AcrR family transcriptional regulator